MMDNPLPEMMRLSLSDLALRIKIMKIKIGTSIEDVLSRAMDPPAVINVQRAISALVEVRPTVSICHLWLNSKVGSGPCADIYRGYHTHGPIAIEASYRCTFGQISTDSSIISLS